MSIMSNPRLKIGLTTNVRKIDDHTLDSEAGVARYQFKVTTKPRFIGQDDTSQTNIALTATEEKAVYRALFRKYVSKERIVLKRSKNDALVDIRYLSEEPSEVSHLVVLTVYEGQDPPPADLKNLDYSTAFTYPAKDASTEESDDHPMDLDDNVDTIVPGLKKVAGFHRSKLPIGHSSSSQRRWLQVHVAELGEAVPLHSVTPKTNNKGVRFYFINVSMECTKLSVREALELFGNLNEEGRAVGLPMPKFKILVGDAEKYDNELSNLQDKTFESRDFPGVQATAKSTFHVHLNGDNDLVLSEKSQTSVHLRSEFATLADFVFEHCRAALYSLQSSDGLMLLTKKLRGVYSKISTSSGHESRMIMGFSKGTLSDVPPEQRHHAWPSDDGLYLSPNLPLVNVGTLEQPLLLPMEVCQVLPDQPLHGPRDVGLNVYLTSINREIALKGLLTTGKGMEAEVAYHTQSEVGSAEMDNRLNEICDSTFPNLVFIEAGKVPINSNSWSKLRPALVASLQKPFQNPTESSIQNGPQCEPCESLPLLSLAYVPGPGPSAQWTQQLHKWLTTHGGAIKQKTIVVVWLESEQDRNAMYKIIKRACEINVGVHTFFVKRETHDSMAHTAKNDQDPVERTITDIRRRICQKNPPMLLEAKRIAASKIVIAMHISPISRASQRGPRRDQNSERYLVTLVSRHLTRSDHYHTERGIFNKSQIESYGHVSKLQTFSDLFSNLTPDNVTILRSGYMPSPQTTNSGVPNCDLTNSTEFARMGDLVVDTVAPHRETPDQQFSLDAEIRAIVKAFKTPNSDVLTYLTVTEDPILETGTEREAKVPLDDNYAAMLFIRDSLLIKSGERSVKVQQVPRVRTQKNFNGVREVRPGAITATFHRSPRSASAPMSQGATRPTSYGSISRVSKVRGPPSHGHTILFQKKSGTSSQTTSPRTDKSGRFIPQRGSRPPGEGTRGLSQYFGLPTSQTATPKSHASGPDDYHEDSESNASLENSPPPDSPTQTTDSKTERSRSARPNDGAPEAGVQNSEIDILTAIWKDEGLGLYNTKWPVPTHLARLAAKRAIVHLRENDWQHASEAATEPFTLPKVHEKVRNSLYYL